MNVNKIIGEIRKSIKRVKKSHGKCPQCFIPDEEFDAILDRFIKDKSTYQIDYFYLEGTPIFKSNREM